MYADPKITLSGNPTFAATHIRHARILLGIQLEQEKRLGNSVSKVRYHTPHGYVLCTHEYSQTYIHIHSVMHEEAVLHPAYKRRWYFATGNIQAPSSVWPNGSPGNFYASNDGFNWRQLSLPFQIAALTQPAALDFGWVALVASGYVGPSGAVPTQTAVFVINALAGQVLGPFNVPAPAANKNYFEFGVLSATECLFTYQAPYPKTQLPGGGFPAPGLVLSLPGGTWKAVQYTTPTPYYADAVSYLKVYTGATGNRHLVYTDLTAGILQDIFDYDSTSLTLITAPNGPNYFGYPGYPAFFPASWTEVYGSHLLVYPQRLPFPLPAYPSWDFSKGKGGVLIQSAAPTQEENLVGGVGMAAGVPAQNMTSLYYAGNNTQAWAPLPSAAASNTVIDDQNIILSDTASLLTSSGAAQQAGMPPFGLYAPANQNLFAPIGQAVFCGPNRIDAPWVQWKANSAELQ